MKLANRGGADIKSSLCHDTSFLAREDLTESYVQMYEIFVQRSGFQHKDLKKTISLVSLKVHLVLGHGLF
jgi:hypothetical protein